MAGYKYYTILTDIGRQKLVEAISNETPIDFTDIAVGDANGVSYDPTGEETALKHEVFKKAIDSVSIDEFDKNIMVFEMVVPASSGGYYIREAGLFASDGSLIAIARTAEQYKPLLEEGAGASITISMRIAISSDVQVYINIPESINYATQNYVQEEFKKHKADENPHAQYVISETYNEKVDELEQALTSKADSNHNHDSVYYKKTDIVNLPVGFIYIQLRNQSTPDVLFKTSGKWQDISSTYAGEFFRAVGGNSASFGSKQNEGLPTFNIVTDRAVQGQNKVLPKGEKLTSANKGLGGMASTQGYNGTSAVAIGIENTSFSQSPFPYFVPNNSIYGASTHVTPYNSAIRIWKKIS